MLENLLIVNYKIKKKIKKELIICGVCIIIYGRDLDQKENIDNYKLLVLHFA